MKALEPSMRPRASEVLERLQAIKDKPKRRRNRLIVTMGILGIVVGAAYYQFQLRQQRNQALRAKTEAESMAGFVMGLFDDRRPVSKGGHPLTPQQKNVAKSLLDQGLERLEEDLTSQPHLAAQLLIKISEAYEGLGFLNDAAEASGKAVTIFRQQQLHLPTTAIEIWIQHASDLLNLSQSDAENIAREAIDMADALESKEAKMHRTQARIMLCDVLRHQGRFPEAVIVAKEAVALSDVDSDQWATGQAALAHCLERLGNYQQATKVHQEVLQYRRQAHQIQGSEETSLALSTSLNGLAQVMRSGGHHNAAEALYREALDLRIQVRGPDHPDVGRILDNLGGLKKLQGDIAAAERLLRKGLDIKVRNLDQRHPEIATSQNNLALVLEDMGHVTQAERLLDDTIGIYIEAFGAEHPYVGVSLTNLARIEARTGRGDCARNTAEEALAIFRLVLPEHHWRFSYIDALMAAIDAAQGNSDGIESRFLEAEATIRSNVGPDTFYSHHVIQWLVDYSETSP